MADGQTDGLDCGREILEIVVVLRRKQQVLPSQSVCKRLRYSLKGPSHVWCIEVDIAHLEKNPPPSQLPLQSLPTSSTTKPNCVDKLTRGEVEERVRAYTASFQVDVSKIPQPSKDVPALDCTIC